MNRINLILNADSYKASHFLQYPENTTAVSSYIESRGGLFEATVFFGLQMFIKQFLQKPFNRLDIEEAGFNLLLIVLLVITSNNYKAISDKGSFRRGIIILAASILFTLIYGTVGFLLLDRHFGPVTLQKAIAQTWNLFFDPQNSLLQPLTNYGRFFKSSIVIIGASSLLLSMTNCL